MATFEREVNNDVSKYNDKESRKKKKIKILFAGISQNLGGIETFIYNLYKNLDKNKYEISFLVDKTLKIAYYDEYKKDGCKFFYTENRKKNYFKYLKDLKDIYKNNKFDIIHINVVSYSLFERISYACKYSSAIVIVHSHSAGFTNGYYKTRLLHNIGKMIIKNKEFYKIACGEKAGRYMFGNEEFEIINNGIDFERFSFSKEYRNEIRQEYNISNNTKLIGIVGAFFPVKNHEFLIKVFKEYHSINQKSMLILIGEGHLKEKIKDQVKEENLQDNVIFAGKRKDIYKIYSAMDIYVMPSISEGLSVSICEAQINGLKCFTSTGVDKDSDISGNVEFIALDQSPKYWAKKIKENDKRDYKVLDKIPKEFNLKYSCELMKQYYNKILKLYK